MAAPRLGLIVNPVAGLGGPVGLKGSDGATVQALARRLGGAAGAPGRAAAALAALGAFPSHVLTAGGAMGEDQCRAAGLGHALVAGLSGETTGAETQAAAALMAAEGVDLILFAGGDGTARDVMAGAGSTPLLGIPAGVKMYSGLFAASPALAGRLAARFLATPPGQRRTREVEVLDIDEAALRRDEPVATLYGIARVPASWAVPRAKASPPADDDSAIAALCRDLAATLEPGCLHIVGPGRTMRCFMAACGLPKTLLGVDVMRDGRLVAADCREADLLALAEESPARIVVGLLGAQGGLLGRGNQPIGPGVIRAVGLSRILVLAGAAKIATLPHGLFVDTGDPALDAALAGYIRVHTAPGRSTLLRIRQPDIGP